jgi:hypothetical protein
MLAACHCRATQFEVAERPDSVTTCTCSICAKRGMLWAYYQPSAFKLLTAPERSAVYQFGRFVVRHHHCAICGCPTYSENPAWTDGQADFTKITIGVNARLIEDFDVASVPTANVNGRDDW